MNYSEILSVFDMSTIDWIALSCAMFVLGVGKAGIKGFSIIIVLILAFIFGEKSSTGVLLPMLVFADILAVVYYKRHVQWKYVFLLLPWMIVGVLVGVWVGNEISEYIFKKTMAVIIVVSVLLMLFFESKNSTAIPKNKLFSSSMGFLAGFTTMIGNLAGPISTIYFLAIRFEKNEFIGTAAWLFFIVNVFKVPFHIFVWKTVTLETIVLNSVLTPMIIIGFLVGVKVVKKIPNSFYRKFILFITAVGGVIMFIRS